MAERTQNGWPVIPEYRDKRLGTIPLFAGSFNVLAGDVETIFRHFTADFNREVMPIKVAQSFGFAPRKIAGKEEWSNHASGTAGDINGTDFPMFKKRYTDAQRKAVKALLARYPVIRWGGDYPAARIDEMHFEIEATAAEVAAFARTLGGVVVVSKMVSPVVGRISSEYGKRGSGVHLGFDIATGSIGVAVRAAFAGRVVRAVSGRVHDRSSGQTKNRGKKVLASGRTPNGLIIQNPDGEKQLYGHVKPSVSEGQQVKAGDIIGFIDLSGNTTGPHLHFETWPASGSTRNPRLYFQANGITPGSAAASLPAPAPKPTPAPSPTPSKPSGDDGTRRVQAFLNKAGYDAGPEDGINGDRTKAAVRSYQSAQNAHASANLVVDGVWGNQTQAWADWVRSLQAGLNNYRGGDIAVDGDYRKVTANRVREVQRNNGLYQDGLAGPKMVGWMRSQGTNIGNRP